MKIADMDLLVIIVITLLLHPLIYIVSVEPVRIALGLLLVLFFPGYVLISALYPRQGQLKGVERIALGLGLSLAVVPLLGLALNFTPWGIGLTPIIVVLTCWILALSVAAWIQRQRIMPEERFGMPWASIVAWLGRPRRPADVTAGLALALAVLSVAGAVAWKVQQPVSGNSFTEFYVLGAQKTLQDYPANLQTGTVQDYNLGIINHENQTVTYIVRAFLDNSEVGSLGPLTIGHGAAWEGTIDVTPVTAGEQQKVELRLYRNPENDAYRTLHLFVDVRE
jgi:uncharacterized membrane protein